MKKLLLLSLITILPNAYAGSMGDGSSCCTGFFSLEGGYTWSNISGYDFTITGSSSVLSSVKSHQGYTGRLGAGILSMLDDELGFTGELGWGYYGRTTLTPEATGVIVAFPSSLSNRYTLSGFDALLGVAYIQPYYSLSFKLGAMLQNMQIKTADDFNPVDAFDIVIREQNSTGVLPEMKLGAAYNIDNNWAITGAFSLAYGSKVEAAGNYNPTTTSADLRINTQNPTMYNFLFGVQYTI